MSTVEVGIRFRIFYAEGDTLNPSHLKWKIEDEDSNVFNVKSLLHINRIDAYINFKCLKQEADEDIKNFVEVSP